MSKLKKSELTCMYGGKQCVYVIYKEINITYTFLANILIKYSNDKYFLKNVCIVYFLSILLLYFTFNYNLFKNKNHK